MMKHIICLLLVSVSIPVFGQDNSTAITRMESSLPDLGDTRRAVDSLTELAWLLYEDTRLEEGKRYAEKARLLSSELNYIQGKSDSHMRLGVLYETELNYDDALKHYQQALKLREVLGVKVNVARVYNNLGAIYGIQGKPDSAIEFFEKGLQILEEITKKNDDELGVLARIHNNIGDAYSTTGDYNQAKIHLEEGIKIREILGNYNHLAWSYLNIGIFYSEEEFLDTSLAASYLNKSLEIFNDSNNVNGEAMAYLQLGNLFYHQEKLDSATLSYNQALETGKLSSVDSIRVFRNFGSILSKKGDYNEALNTFLLYSKRFEEIGNQEEVALLYADIGDLYLILGDGPSSISYLEKSRDYADSLNLFAVKMLAARTLARAHEFEAREIKRRNRTLLIGGLITILAIIGIASFLIYSNRKKRQLAEKNTELANQEVDELLMEQELKTTYARIEGQEKERVRVAQDLHDRLGVMLSTIKLYFSPNDKGETTVDESEDSPYYKASNLLDEACEEVRRISHDMKSPILSNLGLEAELKLLAERIGETKRIGVDIQSHGLQKRLDGQIEIQLYRIIQELIGNALKHANATKIDVQLNRFEDILNVIVEDNGEGFDVEKTIAEGKGIGLDNIAKRLESLEGTFDIDSNLGRGTLTTIDIPLNLNLEKHD